MECVVLLEGLGERGERKEWMGVRVLFEREDDLLVFFFWDARHAGN